MGYMLGQDGSPFAWGGATSPSVPPGGWTDLEGNVYNANGTPYNASGLASDPSGIWSQGMPTVSPVSQPPDWRTTTGYSGVAFNDVAKQVSQQTGIPVDDLAKAFDYQVSTIPSVEGGTLGAANWWGSNQKAQEMLLGYVAQHPEYAAKLNPLINNYGSGVTSQQKGIADYAQAEQAKNGGGGLFGDLAPVLGIAGLALGGAGALGLLGDVGAGGALAGDAMGFGTSGAAGLGAGTSAAGLGVGTAATNAGLGSFLTSGLTGGTLGAGTLGAGALGAGALASGVGAATGGGMSFDLFDPSTWSNPFSGFFSSGTGAAPSTDFSSLIKPDGSLDYSALAAQDAANFGPSGVNALGNSLGYSGGVDYANPMLTDSQISQMLNGNPSLASQVSNYVASNPGSTVQTALRALGGGAGLIGNLGFPALGALLGGMNGAKQAGVTSVTQLPWEGQAPYLRTLFGNAQNTLGTGANPNAYQTSAANTLQKTTTSGPTSNPYLGVDNPYLTKAINNANQDIQRGIQPVWDQMARQNGDFGNSGINETMARQLAETMQRTDTAMRMGDYTNQQNLYANAVQNTANNANGLMSAGSYLQQMPWQNVLNFGKAVGGANYGNTTNTPYYTNPGSGMLGGAIAGSQIYNNLYGNKSPTTSNLGL